MEECQNKERGIGVHFFRMSRPHKQSEGLFPRLLGQFHAIFHIWHHQDVLTNENVRILFCNNTELISFSYDIAPVKSKQGWKHNVKAKTKLDG